MKDKDHKEQLHRCYYFWIYFGLQENQSLISFCPSNSTFCKAQASLLDFNSLLWLPLTSYLICYNYFPLLCWRSWKLQALKCMFCLAFVFHFDITQPLVLMWLFLFFIKQNTLNKNVLLHFSTPLVSILQLVPFIPNTSLRKINTGRPMYPRAGSTVGEHYVRPCTIWSSLLMTRMV